MKHLNFPRLVCLFGIMLYLHACHDHDSQSTTPNSDSSLIKTDSSLNQQGTGYGNSISDTVGVTNMGSATDTSGSLGQP